MYPLPRGSPRCTSCHLNNRECFEKGGDPERVLTAGLHAAFVAINSTFAHAQHCSANVVPGYAQIEKGDDETRPWGMDVLQAYMDKQLGKECVPPSQIPISMSTLSPRNRS